MAEELLTKEQCQAILGVAGNAMTRYLRFVTGCPCRTATPPTPDPIRAALEALVEHVDALSGTYGHRLGCDCGGTPDGTHSCGSFRSAIAAARAALAAQPPAPDEALRARGEFEAYLFGHLSACAPSDSVFRQVWASMLRHLDNLAAALAARQEGS